MVPRFAKAVDDRVARADWRSIAGPVDVVLLEGWCLGAQPQRAALLKQPINALERDEDGHGNQRHPAHGGAADGAVAEGLALVLIARIQVQPQARHQVQPRLLHLAGAHQVDGDGANLTALRHQRLVRHDEDGAGLQVGVFLEAGVPAARAAGVKASRHGSASETPAAFSSLRRVYLAENSWSLLMVIRSNGQGA